MTLEGAIAIVTGASHNQELVVQFEECLENRRFDFGMGRVELAQEDLNCYVAAKDSSVNNVTKHHLLERTPH